MARRKSTSEKFKALLEAPDDVQNKWVQKRKERELKAYDYRPYTLATQRAQDKVLKDYYDFIKIYHPPFRTGSPSKADLEEIGFPTDFLELYRVLRSFLEAFLDEAKPRSYKYVPSPRSDGQKWRTTANRVGSGSSQLVIASQPVIDCDKLLLVRLAVACHLLPSGLDPLDSSFLTKYRDDRITYNSASTVRDHLLFWVSRVYRKRGGARPEHQILLQETTEALRSAAEEFQLKAASTPKAYIGLAEIRFLMDREMRYAASVEVSECHSLAWAIARVTALRPGSLGAPRPDTVLDPSTDQSFLIWRDVQLKRLADVGSYMLRLKIRTWKGNPGIANVGRTFNLSTPTKSSNLIFSIPHRLIVIGLRRGVFEDFTDLDGLLSGTHVFLKIKDDFLDKPVLIRPVGNGYQTNPDLPMYANTLSSYLQRCGRRAGFAEAITFYSIRRRTATNLARVFGNDTAREIMGHVPTSSTLERYYIEFAAMMALVSAALAESSVREQELLQDEENQLLLERLDQEQVRALQGRQLTALVDEALVSDLEYHKLTDRSEKIAYQRRMRLRVFDAA